MTLTRGFRGAWLGGVLLAGVGLVGCGASSASKGAAPPASAPAAEAAEPAAKMDANGAEEPTTQAAPSEEDETLSLATLDDANAAFERAQRELEALFGAPRAGAGTGADAEELAGGSGGACAETCKAFASLGRAADAICRMAGDETPRCRKARDTVSANQRRVAACVCR